MQRVWEKIQSLKGELNESFAVSILKITKICVQNWRPLVFVGLPPTFLHLFRVPNVFQFFELIFVFQRTRLGKFYRSEDKHAHSCSFYQVYLTLNQFQLHLKPLASCSANAVVCCRRVYWSIGSLFSFGLMSVIQTVQKFIFSPNRPDLQIVLHLLSEINFL